MNYRCIKMSRSKNKFLKSEQDHEQCHTTNWSNSLTADSSDGLIITFVPGFVAHSVRKFTVMIL